MKLVRKVLSIVLMLGMLLGNIFIPVSVAVADTDSNGNIILLSKGSTWGYVDDGSDQGTAWREPTFNDSAWKTGPAPLGYSASETNSLNGTIKTVIGYGSNSRNKYPTSYFRTTFNVSDLSEVGNSGSIRAGIDDAAVIYLNGHEIARTNLPSKSDVTEIGYDKYVNFFGTSFNDATEGATLTFTMGATEMSYLVQGENVLAAEVHQGRADSSDVYWDMEFVASASDGSSSGGGNGYAATDITFAPGRNATELNFAWYSNVVTTSSAIQVAKKADMTGTEFPAAKTTFTGTTSSAITGFFSNKVTVTGLQESTEYVYRVGDGSESWSPAYNFTTHQTDSFSFLAVGDPQIGAGSLASDTIGWKDTMSKALAQFPDVSFLVSIGDQINTNNNEAQYTSFFSPPEFRSLPLAPLVGNHDNGAANYNYHFNLPNLSSQYGITNASSDYYYTYGDTLFMVLNTNNSSGAEHDAFMEQAIGVNSNAKWKVVMFHQDIYGSASHSTESSILNLRQALVPIFDKYKIDLVLNGHDHSYTRTYPMYGDQALPNQMVDGDGAVVNPLGTIYLTLNSASGSKYYGLKSTPETYAAVRSQINVPTFSRITETANSLSISTYRTDTMAMTDTYTIKKDAAQTSPLDLDQVTLSADGATLATEDSASKIELSLAAKDTQGAAVDLSGAIVSYKTDKPNIVSIVADGTKTVVTVKNKPVIDETVKVWADVFDGTSFVSSNQLDINVKNPYGLAEVTLAADSSTLSSDTATAKLHLTAKDTLGVAMDLASATTVYKTDQDGVLAISPDGTVSIQNKPAHAVTVKISAEVTIGGKTVTSNTVSIAVSTTEGGNEITAPIKNALDDIEERVDGSVDWGSSDLEITWEDPTGTDVKNQLIGLRFSDLAIPEGAEITDAYIQFSVDEKDKSTDPFKVNIYAEDVPNSAAFDYDPLIEFPHSVSSRVKTTDSIEWKEAPLWTTEHEAGSAQQTPNLSSLVQKIVDKDGWNEGNAINFILSGKGNRTAESFEGAGSKSEQVPTLHIIYSSGTDTDFSISAARALGNGKAATVIGVVTGVNAVIDGLYFIQDSNAGISIYNPSLSPAPQKGDEILVTGPMSLYEGLLVMMPETADVSITSSGNPLPEPKVITIDQLADYEGQRVKLQNATLGTINIGDITTVTDETGSTVIYGTPALTDLSAGDKVDIIAISAIANSAVLIVQSAADIVKVEQPESILLAIDVEKQIIEVGEEAIVTLSAMAVKDLYGFDLSLKYDPEIFEYVSVTPKTEFDLDEAGVTHDANGNIHIVGVLKGASTGIDGDIDLATVKLKAKGKDALSTITLLASSAFSDGNLEVCTLDQDVVKNIAVANSDVTKNSELQINDLVMVAKLFGVEQSVVGSGYETAIDMNKDGIIDIEDLAYVAKMLLKR